MAKIKGAVLRLCCGESKGNKRKGELWNYAENAEGAEAAEEGARTSIAEILSLVRRIGGGRELGCA